MSGVSDLLLASSAAVVAGGGLVTGAAVVTWLRVRRRWRALRSSTSARIGVALLGVVRSGSGGGRPWRRDSPAVLRLQLWQSVDAAARALQEAERAGGTVGDLPSLCRRLRAASEDLDRLLVAAGGSGPPAGPPADPGGSLARQVAEMQDAATSIRRAALASATDAAALRAGPLAEDARREVASVTAGLARAVEASNRRPVA